MSRNGAGVPEISVFSDVPGQKIMLYPAEVDTFDGFLGHINQASCTQSASDRGELIYDTYITKAQVTRPTVLNFVIMVTGISK